MKTFTIDAENNITVFGSKKEAAVASVTPFDGFANQNEFAELIADWPMPRLAEVWNGIPGVTRVSKFTSRKIAAERIWKAIQGLGDAPKKTKPEAGVPAPEPKPEIAGIHEAPAIVEMPPPQETPVAAQGDATMGPTNEASPSEPVADAGAQVADAAPVVEAAAQPSTPVKKARKTSPKTKAAKVDAKPGAARERSKTARVVEMLQRKNGATLSEIMDKMGWQRHTVRGFMAGAMKKAGYTVESFKPEGGERTYRINP